MIANLFKKEKKHKSSHENQNHCEKLSYIILSKDRRGLLEKKLDSLRKRQGAKEEQIFIGEDNQTNDSRLVKNHLIAPDVRPLERLETLVQSVLTEYCVLTADDDLIITKEIGKHIHFLDQNSDYSASQGLFYSRMNPISPNESYRQSLDEESTEERVLSLISNYGHFYYAIIRTSVLRNMCSIFKNLKSQNSLNFQEVLWCASLAASGKINVMHEPYVLRDPTQTKGWWRDFMEGNLAEHLNEDGRMVSKAIMKMTPSFKTDTLVELILYFIFKDTTCLSEETKDLVAASQKRASGIKSLPEKLKTLCTEKWE